DAGSEAETRRFSHFRSSRTQANRVLRALAEWRRSGSASVDETRDRATPAGDSRGSSAARMASRSSYRTSKAPMPTFSLIVNGVVRDVDADGQFPRDGRRGVGRAGRR